MNLRISFDPEMRPTGDDWRAEKKSAAGRRCGEMSSKTGGTVPVDIGGVDPPDVPSRFARLKQLPATCLSPPTSPSR